jgi:uncharacterized protein with HEPN domain
MRSKNRRIDALRHIVTYCDDLEKFLLGFSREAFDRDLRTIRAVLYSLQTIGEAAIRLDKDEKRRAVDGELEGRYPQIPWRDVRGMSNFVRHQYDEIDLDLVWTTATKSIFPIRDAAKLEIARLEGLVEDNFTDIDDELPSP